jgi:hypothetical protein
MGRITRCAWNHCGHSSATFFVQCPDGTSSRASRIVHDGRARGTDVDYGCMRCTTVARAPLQDHREVHVRVRFSEGACHPVPLVSDLSYPMDRSVALDHAPLVRTKQTDSATHLFGQAARSTMRHCLDVRPIVFGLDYRAGRRVIGLFDDERNDDTDSSVSFLRLFPCPYCNQWIATLFQKT